MASYTITIKHLSGSKRGTTDAFVQLPLRIGRSETCQLQFDPDLDLKVSAEHAEIRCGETGELEIVDLGSTNGVLVNGLRLEGTTRLPDRATLEVGGGGPRMQVTFEEGGGFSLKRARAAAAQATSGRKLAATDASFPVLKKDDLEEEGASPIAGLPPAALAGIAGGGAILLVGLLWWLLS